MNRAKLHAIPAVEKVLQALGEIDTPRPAVVAVVRRQLALLRKAETIPNFDAVVSNTHAALDALRRARIQSVINGTGILIHTNLGRTPLGPEVIEAMAEIGANYNNLEYDIVGGERGGRAVYLEHNLALLCGAEAATVVNNCAAALVLILHHFTSGIRKEVLISRGELLQIGGGFRVPEILEASGAVLREIGTTNKTSLSDYARAIGPKTAVILKVHRSNFFMSGFVDAAATEEIASLAYRKHIPFVEDLGSGAVVRTEHLAAIEHEPTPAEILKRGVDLVCFSGDKLFGSVQSGIIAGKGKLVAAIKREPFFRALRCDKLILCALQTLVDIYLEGEAECAGSQIPLFVMLRISNEELRVRAETIVASLAELPLDTRIGEGKGEVGGGSLPRSVIASTTVELRPHNLGLPAFATRLRLAVPPVIGYVSAGLFKVDLRTVFPRQDKELVRAIRSVF